MVVPIVQSQLFLSTFLIFGVVISYLPQLLKIIRTASSDGLSPWYLLLGALSCVSNLLNIIVLQVPVFKCCLKVDAGHCLYSLLGLMQTASQVSMFFSVFALFYMYFPSDKKYLDREGGDESRRETRDWRHSVKALKITGIFVVSVGLLSTAIVSVAGVPSTAATSWTALLALIALVSSSIQFIPQIIRTWELKMVGALSVPAMMMQTPGSFLFCYTIAISPGTNFTSWITYFVGGCLQGTLLVLCIYYQNTHPSEFIRVGSEDTDRHPEGGKGSDAPSEGELGTVGAEIEAEAEAETLVLGSARDTA